MSDMTYTEALESSAEASVNANPALRPYRDILINYDWPNRDEHLAWVASAPEAEIIAWCEEIRRDENAEAELVAADFAFDAAREDRIFGGVER